MGFTGIVQTMGEFVEFSFDDQTSVLMEVFAAPGGLNDTGSGSPEESFPAAVAPLTPVGHTSEVVTRAGRSLEDVLRPLVPTLQAVHRTVLHIPHAPDEVTVTLGVKLASNPQLGIVGGKGEASLTVAATWRITPNTTAPNTGAPSATAPDATAPQLSAPHTAGD